MISKGPVEKDLKRLNRLYQASVSGSDRTVPIFYSKLAVLELTGWVEESFDVIARRAVKNQVQSNRFSSEITKVINRNHGFAYSKNFLPMMAPLIGFPACEELHEYLESDGSASVLDNELGALLTQRRKAAHVNVANTSTQYDAPSVTLGRLSRIHPILKDIYSWFC